MTDEDLPGWIDAFPEQIGTCSREIKEPLSHRRFPRWRVFYRDIGHDGELKKSASVKPDTHGPYRLDVGLSHKVWRPTTEAAVSTLRDYLVHGDDAVCNDLGPTPPNWPAWLNDCPGQIGDWIARFKYRSFPILYSTNVPSVQDPNPYISGTEREVEPVVIIRYDENRDLFTIHLDHQQPPLGDLKEEERVIGVIHSQQKFGTRIRQVMAAHGLIDEDEIVPADEQDDEENYEILEDTPDEPAADQPVRDNILWPHEDLFDDS